MVETDCLDVIQAIHRTIEKCKKLLVELKDHEVSLVFVRRFVNETAHFLARESCSVAD